MATRITISPPIVIGDLTLDALRLRPMTGADLFRATRELSDTGSPGELKNRVAALCCGQPYVVTRTVPLAVQRAIEDWWLRQWAREAPALPPAVREPVAGDWFDAHDGAGWRAGDLEVQARVYALCANIAVDAIGALPPAALDQVKTWYDQRAGAAVSVDDEEAGSAAVDPSPVA